MSRRYKVFDTLKPYFVTSSVAEWVKIFYDKNIVDILIESIRFCQSNKGLEIYAYVIMPDHFHMICRSIDKYNLSEILRDLKKFTSRSIIKYLRTNTNSTYSQWIRIFQRDYEEQKRNKRYKLWQDGFNPKELSSNKVIDQKIEYIHNNPVKAGLVIRPEEYKYSSSRNYADMEGVIEVIVTHERWLAY